MLHVLDGDATRPAFAASGIEGDVVVWREIMCQGPTPNALQTPADRQARAATLEREESIPAAELLGEVDRALATVRAAAERGEEIVLWFDEDLFCRVHAAYFAWLFPKADMTNATGGHRAREPAHMRARLDLRAPLDARLAQAWLAYGAADPRALEPLAASFGWVRRHLERFPHVRDGLDPRERHLLRALEDGPRLFDPLFRSLSTAFPPHEHGITDREASRLLADLSPLVRHEDGEWEITHAGRDVLAGRADRMAVAPVDRWLGGARVLDGWRWDGGAIVR